MVALPSACSAWSSSLPLNAAAASANTTTKNLFTSASSLTAAALGAASATGVQGAFPGANAAGGVRRVASERYELVTRPRPRVTPPKRLDRAALPARVVLGSERRAHGLLMRRRKRPRRKVKLSCKRPTLQRMYG